jgi:two-component system sensor histidine kinase GlrK
MRILPWFPRSYATALIGAFSLAIAPLAIALGHATLQIYNLADRSEAWVERAAELGTEVRAMREALVEIERTTRQAEVLGTTALIETLTRQTGRFDASAARIAHLVGSARAGELQAGAARSVQALAGEFRRGQAVAALAMLPDLEAAASALDAHIQDALTNERAALAARPSEVSTELAWIAGLALPLTLTLVALFAWRLGAPVRHLGAAMRRLGDGDLSTPVAVRGPREIARLGEGLEWLRARLATLESARERFLRGVSHDLKTPIAAIAEGGALLDDELYGALTPKQRAVVDLIAQNAARLLERIENLLRAASIAPSTSPLAARVNLADVARAVLEEHRLTLEHRGLRIDARLVAAEVSGDAERLRIAIDNLLSNAIKVSPAGARIHLVLAIDGGQAQLEVLDQGPGLAPGEEEEIFRLATRGSAARTLGTRGSGQGLAIAREFAEAHGGRLFAAPAERGARFVLLLPLATGAATAGATAAPMP